MTQTLRASWCMTRAMLRVLFGQGCIVVFGILLFSLVITLILTCIPEIAVSVTMCTAAITVAILSCVLPSLALGAEKSHKVTGRNAAMCLPLHHSAWFAVSSLIVWAVFTAWITIWCSVFLAPLRGLLTCLMALPIIAAVALTRALWPQAMFIGDRHPLRRPTLLLVSVLSVLAMLHFTVIPVGEMRPGAPGVVFFFYFIIFGQHLARWVTADLPTRPQSARAGVFASRTTLDPRPHIVLSAFLLLAIVMAPLLALWGVEHWGWFAGADPIAVHRYSLLTPLAVAIFYLTASVSSLGYFCWAQTDTLPIDSALHMRRSTLLGLFGAFLCLLVAFVSIEVTGAMLGSHVPWIHLWCVVHCLALYCILTTFSWNSLIPNNGTLVNGLDPMALVFVTLAMASLLSLFDFRGDAPPALWQFALPPVWLLLTHWTVGWLRENRDFLPENRLPGR